MCLLLHQSWHSVGWCFCALFRCLVCRLGVSLAALCWCSAVGSVSVCCFVVWSVRCFCSCISVGIPLVFLCVVVSLIGPLVVLVFPLVVLQLLY